MPRLNLDILRVVACFFRLSDNDLSTRKIFLTTSSTVSRFISFNRQVLLQFAKKLFIVVEKSSDSGDFVSSLDDNAADNPVQSINFVRTFHGRHQKTEISRLFCARTRRRHHVLVPTRSRPSISMTTDASLNARRLRAIDRPLASPYSTSEIPGLFVTATIYRRRLLNVDPPSTRASRRVAALSSRQ